MASGGEDALRVERVLERLVEAPQHVVVVRVSVERRVDERGRGPVLSPAVLGANADELLDRGATAADALRSSSSPQKSE